MRDLTKAVTSYTWAMSVFWTQQMLNVLGLGGPGSWNRGTRALNNVTEATSNEMGDTTRAVFRSGDTLQRGMVDLFLAPFTFMNWLGGAYGSRDAGRGGAESAGGARGSDTGYAARGSWAASGGARRSDGGDDARGWDGGQRGTGWGDPRVGGWAEANRGPGWGETAARATAAGADVVQAAVDATARATRRAADAMAPSGDSNPGSSDSGGWGPMPR